MEQISDSTRGAFVSSFPTREWPQRRAGTLLERLEGRAFDSREGNQDLETPNGVENLLDHSRTHVDDTRFNILLRRCEAVAGQVNPLIKAHVFLRKANLSAWKQSQIASAAMSRYEYEPLRDATLTAIPRAGALRGGVP